MSPFSVSIDSCEAKKCKSGHGPVKAVAPQLNCVTLQNGEFKSHCGAVRGGQRFVQWYPVNAGEELVKYTVYAKRGRSEVSPTDNDFSYSVAPDSHYLLTPPTGDGPVSFAVTSTVTREDGTELESPPSEVFETI
ncbi:MAG: hypothetical protein H0X02_06610 [Nitrosomonas sp.]|nr:hypothetical protein [Nitrosomonas sp.]